MWSRIEIQTKNMYQSTSKLWRKSLLWAIFFLHILQDKRMPRYLYSEWFVKLLALRKLNFTNFLFNGIYYNTRILLWIFLYILVNGGWTNWGEYGQCSKTCGLGSKVKRRTCTNPPPSFGGSQCSGTSSSSTSCKMKECPGISTRSGLFNCWLSGN